MLTDARFLCVGAVDCLWRTPFWKQETWWSWARYLAFNFFSRKIWGVVGFNLYIFILTCFYIFYSVFTRCGAYEEALSSFQKSGNWRQVFCMASLLRHTDEQVISLARSVAGMNSFCVPFHENAKPVIFLMITVRGIETQSISKTLSTLKKNVLSKSTFYGHCLFKNVNGTIELLCMGICGRCFRRAFSIKSSAFQRNLRISKIVVLLNACCELKLLRPRRRKR